MLVFLSASIFATRWRNSTKSISPLLSWSFIATSSSKYFTSRRKICAGICTCQILTYDSPLNFIFSKKTLPFPNRLKLLAPPFSIHLIFVLAPSYWFPKKMPYGRLMRPHQGGTQSRNHADFFRFHAFTRWEENLGWKLVISRNHAGKI